MIDLDGVDISSDEGVIVHTIFNDDPCKTPADGDVFGVNVNMTDMDVKGDLIHEDPERDMWVKLASTTLTGGIQNAIVKFEPGAKFIATKDSKITLFGECDPAQIDAFEGVTVTVKGAEEATFDCPGGGKVVVTK